MRTKKIFTKEIGLTTNAELEVTLSFNDITKECKLDILVISSRDEYKICLYSAYLESCASMRDIEDKANRLLAQDFNFSLKEMTEI